MNTLVSLRDLIPNFGTLIFIGARLLLIAVAFEFIAWYAGRRLAALTDSFSKIDEHRETSWRVSRRNTLRRVPRFIARFLIYTIAGVIVLGVFGVPLLPLALAFGGVALMIGAGLMPILRDYAQGYFLLAEDSIAPGDALTVNGHVGTVEKFSLRAIWLRDETDCQHVISNREVRDVTILRKSSGVIVDGRDPEELDEDNLVRKPKLGKGVAFDPLDEQHSTKRPPKARQS